MKLSVCCILALGCGASRPGPGIPQPPGQDMVEIDFEPIGGPQGMDPMEVMMGAPDRAPEPAKKGLSEKELDDVLSDMLGPENAPQKSSSHDLPGGGPPPGGGPHNLPSDAEVVQTVMGNGQNGLPDGTMIEFDGPPPQSEKDMDELLAALTGGRPEPRPDHKPEMDAPPQGPEGEEIIMGTGRNGIPEGVEVEVVGGDEPPPEIMMMEDGPGGPRGGPEEIPPEILKQLFPPGQMVIEEDDGPGPSHGGRPPPGADAVIQDLMQEMDQAMVQQVMPMEQQQVENNLPTSCSKEIKAHCKDAKSQLHCLGKYPSAISDGCRADIGHAVPFLCSDAIDQYCDVLMGGILSCLGNQLNSLEGPCKDAVVATKKIIQKVNSKKTLPAAPKKASLSAHEAKLDAALVALSSKPVAKPSLKKPAAVPHLQEKLLDHDMRPKEHAETSTPSPPFMAVFLPLCILLAGAFAVRQYGLQQHARAYVGGTLMEKQTMQNDESYRPLRTSAGMELLNPGGRFDLEI